MILSIHHELGVFLDVHRVILKVVGVEMYRLVARYVLNWI